MTHRFASLILWLELRDFTLWWNSLLQLIGDRCSDTACDASSPNPLPFMCAKLALTELAYTHPRPSPLLCSYFVGRVWLWLVGCIRDNDIIYVMVTVIILSHFLPDVKYNTQVGAKNWTIRKKGLYKGYVVSGWGAVSYWSLMWDSVVMRSKAVGDLTACPWVELIDWLDEQRRE